MRISLRALSCVFLVLCNAFSFAQSNYAPSAYPTIPTSYLSAQNVSQAFWIGIDPNNLGNENEFKTIAASGFKGVRIECDWQQMEQFKALPVNQSNGYQLTSSCQAAENLILKYGLHASVSTPYYSPQRFMMYVYPTAPINAGATTASVAYWAGSYNTAISGGINNIVGDKTIGLCTNSGFINNDTSVSNTVSCEGGLYVNQNKYHFGGTVLSSSISNGVANVHIALAASASFQDVPNPTPDITQCTITSGDSGSIKCAAGTFPTDATNLIIDMPNGGRGGGATCTSDRFVKVLSTSADGSTIYPYGVYCDQTHMQQFTVHRVMEVMQRLYPPPDTQSPTEPFNLAAAKMAAWAVNKFSTDGVKKGFNEPQNEPGSLYGFWIQWDPNYGYDYWYNGPWSSKASYTLAKNTGRVVLGSDGKKYFNLTANTGIDPTTDDGTNWTTTIPDDAYPGPFIIGYDNYGIYAAIQQQPAYPSGWSSVNGYGWNNGYHILQDKTALNNGGFEALTGLAWDPFGNVRYNTAHPYSGNSSAFPEAQTSPYSCITGLSNPAGWGPCHTPGADGSSQLMNDYSLAYAANKVTPGSGGGLVATETNAYIAYTGEDERIGTFDTRQFLSLVGDGVEAVMFYVASLDTGTTQMIANPGAPSFSMMSLNSDGTIKTKYKSYLAVESLIGAVDPLAAQAPLTYSTSNLSQVQAASAPYPMNSFHIVGRRAGQIQNSELLALYQVSAPGNWTGTVSGTVLTVTGLVVRPAASSNGPQITSPLIPGSVLNFSGIKVLTQTDSTETDGHLGGKGHYQLSGTGLPASGGYYSYWTSQAPPPPYPVTVTLPAGYHVANVLNVATQSTDSSDCTFTTSTATCGISDQPRLLDIEPNVQIIIPCLPGILCGPFPRMGR